jgi:hypothetical protein
LFFTSLELIIEKRLAKTALAKPEIIPLVYCVSNLKIKKMPVIINEPANISSFEMRFLLIMGSKIAVNKVMEERQTRVTGTVDNLMDAKNNIQWPPTSAPVNINLMNVWRFTLKVVLLNLK